MAKNIKHVGLLANTGRKVVVVFREVPGEPESCLVVDTDALPDWMHDDVINAVETPSAQASGNFYEYAARALFSDGSNMLNTMHTKGLLNKHPTSNVKMTPNSGMEIMLDQLNTMIAEAGGKEAVAKPDNRLDMATKQVENTSNSNVIDDADLAKNMLDQAAQFEAEAKRLKDQAYEMAPDLKPKRGSKAKTPA